MLKPWGVSLYMGLCHLGECHSILQNTQHQRLSELGLSQVLEISKLSLQLQIYAEFAH